MTLVSCLASMLGIRSCFEHNTDTIYTAAATDIDGDDADIIYSLGSGNDEGSFRSMQAQAH